MGKLDHLKVDKTAGGPRPGKGRAPKQADSKVRFRCGHEVPASRMMGAECPQCRAKTRTARAAKAEAERQARAAGLHSRNPEGGGGRLPDQSRFDVTYDAGKGEWSGDLHVGMLTLHDVASGVFRLLQKLDAAYRSWLSAQPAPAGGE